MKKLLVALAGALLCALALAAQTPYSVEVGTGHLLLPNSGNYVAAGWQTQWQLKAAFQFQITKDVALKIIYAQDTLKPQEWALEHDFTALQPYGFKYNLWDAEIAFPVQWSVDGHPAPSDGPSYRASECQCFT